MIRTTVRKAFRDLVREKSRTILAILAIAVGVIASGAALTSYSILTRELERGFMASVPPFASIFVDGIDAPDYKALQKLPILKAAEIRSRIMARVKVGESSWKNLWIYVVEDFHDMRIRALRPQAGAWPPGPGEILFERQSFKVAAIPVGSSITVRLSNGLDCRLTLSGSLHDIQTAPAWMENLVYGYITTETAGLLNGAPLQREIMITASGDAMDRDHNRVVAEQTSAWLSARGVPVLHREIPEPGKHVHADQMDSLLLLQIGFGILALILSCFLVVTLVSSLLSRQVRQIAVMKACGASTGAVGRIYFSLVLFLGFAALLIGAPLGLLIGRAYAAYAADTLNFIISDASVPLAVFAVEAFSALLLPVIVAAFPIRRGAARSVRESLSDYGLSTGRAGSVPSGRFFAAIFPSNRPMRLALRNAVRARGRFIRALLALAFGGAVFMTGLNLRSALQGTVRRYFDGMKFDISLKLSRTYPIGTLDAVLKVVPGVKDADYSFTRTAQIVRDNGGLSNTYRVGALPIPSRSFSFVIWEGRWLAEGDGRAIVITNKMAKAEPALSVGRKVKLRLDGTEAEWTVIGIADDPGATAGLYLSYGSYAGLLPVAGTADTAQVFLEERSGEAALETKKLLEDALQRNGIGVTSQSTLGENRKIIDDHLQVITFFLIAMSCFMIVVGSLGLASAMSVNALDRRREIGIMRAIGAGRGRVMALVMSEGVATSIASWVAALALSLPATLFMGAELGLSLLGEALPYTLNVFGLAAWPVISLGIGTAAGLFPALQAARASVREALGYE